MSGIDRAHRMAIMAVVNGLRKGGDISEASIAAIAGELRAATVISKDYGHHDTTDALIHLAEAVETGTNGK